jgi:hypothetical protein
MCPPCPASSRDLKPPSVDKATGSIHVADTGNHTIMVIRPDNSVAILGSGASISGDRDNLIAANATFASPRGLLWVGGKTGLFGGHGQFPGPSRVFQHELI